MPLSSPSHHRRVKNTEQCPFLLYLLGGPSVPGAELDDDATRTRVRERNLDGLSQTSALELRSDGSINK